LPPWCAASNLEPGRDVFIAFSPERIDPGNERYGVRNTPKVVGGLTPECGRRAREFYAHFIDTVVEAKRAREAEMAKLLENTFRHVNIALVNEMVRFCDELDIDLWDAIDCAETKPFGFMAFQAGPGRRWPLHPGRPVLPLPPRQGKARLRVPSRRAGRGDQHRGTALRGRPGPGPPQRPGKVRARRSHPAPGSDLQA
jgi:hypothetical protein